MLAYYSNYLQGLWDFTGGFGSDIQNTNLSTGGVIAAATAQAPNTADAALIAKQDPANTNAYAGAFVQTATEQAILTCFQDALQQIFASQQYKDNATGFLAEIAAFAQGLALRVTNGPKNMGIDVNDLQVIIGKAGGPVMLIDSGGSIGLDATVLGLGTYTGKAILITDTAGNSLGHLPIYS